MRKENGISKLRTPLRNFIHCCFTEIILLLLILAGMFFPSSLFADKPEEITAEEWNTAPPESDPNAGAIVIFDKGILDISLRHDIRLYRHVRIKIFNKNAAQDVLEVEIPYFEKEKIKDLKAYTCFPDGNYVKVDDFYEKEFGSYKVTAFAFPAVEDGVILDYSYCHEHKRYHFLDPWVFQSSIYTKKSCFSVVLERGMAYDYYKSNIPLNKSLPKTTMYPDGFKYAEYMYTWELEDLPALKSEPLMSLSSNYTSSINIHLVAIYFYMNELSFVGKWADLGDFYQSWVDSFALGIDTLDVIAAAACKDATDDDLKIRDLYEYVRDGYETRGSYGFFLEDSAITEVIKNKYGTATEKNMLLVKLIKSQGIEAFPLLIGTSDYSRFNVHEYNLRQFNKALCFVINGEDSLTLDTEDRLVSYPFVPARDEISAGLLVNGDSSRVISLNRKNRRNCTEVTTQMNVDSGGNAACVTTICARGHCIEQFRKVLNDSVSTDKMAEDLLGGLDLDYDLTKCSCSLDLPGDSLILSLEYDLPEYASAIGDNIFINPFVFPVFENPFTGKTRYFPVDFRYSFYNYHKITVAFPEGYELADVPTEISYKIDGVRFSRSFLKQTHSVDLTAHLDFKEHLFLPEKYTDLKDMCEAVGESCFDQIAVTKAAR